MKGLWGPCRSICIARRFVHPKHKRFCIVVFADAVNAATAYTAEACAKVTSIFIANVNAFYELGTFDAKTIVDKISERLSKEVTDVVDEDLLPQFERYTESLLGHVRTTLAKKNPRMGDEDEKRANARGKVERALKRNRAVIAESEELTGEKVTGSTRPREE